jgi:serine/threonine protein phosphatase 1
LNWKLWRSSLRAAKFRRAVEFKAPSMSPQTLPDAGRDIAIVADVHGMDGALEAILDLLAREAPQARVIFVGDLIDRGDNSAQVLRQVCGLGDTVEVLLGNHEEMALNFLNNPEQNGEKWLRYGGLQTLASFGIGGIRETSFGTELEIARDAFRDALGENLVQWLRERPRIWRGGNVAVTHAGADPWRPIEMQTAHDLTWGHPDFGKRARRDGLWVVHGHEIVSDPVCAAGIISIDTGAYAGGRLTAAILSDGTVRFLGVPS